MRKRTGILALAMLCVVAVLYVASKPLATYSVSIDLPADASTSPINPTMNRIAITSQDQLLWNGKPTTLAGIEANVRQSLTLPVEPELQFVPDSQASYALSAKVLNVIKNSKATKFGFVGNEKYVTH